MYRLISILVIVPITVVLTVKLIVPSSIRNGERSKETIKFPSISSPFSVYKLKVRASFSSIENIIEVTEQLFFEVSEERTHSPIIALVCSDGDPPDPSMKTLVTAHHLIVAGFELFPFEQLLILLLNLQGHLNRYSFENLDQDY